MSETHETVLRELAHMRRLVGANRLGESWVAAYDRTTNAVEAGADALRDLAALRAENATLREMRQRGCDCSDDDACRYAREQDALRARVAALEAFEQTVRDEMERSEPRPLGGQQVTPSAELWQMTPSTRKRIKTLLAALTAGKE